MALILGAPGTGFCSVSFRALLFSVAKYARPLSHVAKERPRMSLIVGHRLWLIIRESCSCELFPGVVIWCLGFCRPVPLASMVLTYQSRDTNSIASYLSSGYSHGADHRGHLEGNTLRLFLRSPQSKSSVHGGSFGYFPGLTWARALLV